MVSRTKKILVAAIAAAIVVALVVTGVILLNRPRVPPTVDSAAIGEAVTTENVAEHLTALQQAADANGGNRQAGTPGFEASIDYVESLLRSAGYETRRQRFTYERTGRSEATVERTSPTATMYEQDVDFRAMAGSGSGTATAPVTSIDLNLEVAEATTSGCESSDFADFPPGNIALVQRGGCLFEVKVRHAADAGASAVVVLNQGNGPDGQGLFAGSLGVSMDVPPVVATTVERGTDWATPGTRLTVSVDARGETVTTENLIADTGGDSENTIVVGAHLDGVAAGPGINDNGSGVASVLETAIQFGRLGVQPANRVRFAFWSGEEDGLHGSRHYIAALDAAERRQTALYLNLDMVGSPNPVPYVYGGGHWPSGSEVIESVLADFFTSRGVEPQFISFDASDHHAFAEAGIPIGGLHTGSSETKTEDEAAQHGGTADEPLDPCYHESCDRAENIDEGMLGLMADAVVHATLTFAQAPDPVG